HVRPLERGGLRELDVDEEVALVLLGHEGPRQDLPEPAREDGERGEHEERHAAPANEAMGAADVAVLRPPEDAVEGSEEASEGPARPLLRSRTEYLRALRRLVRERIDGREQDRERDRERELPVERAGDAADEGSRNEDAGEHERDPDERAADLVHRRDRGVVRRHALVDLRLDRLDDDDRVVHDESDGENEAEERERVDREPDHRKEEEHAQQGYRDGLDRDPRRPETPEEDEHHEEDEPDRLGQRD